MADTREKLIELIGLTEYGKGSLVGNNFQRGFIEKIADHLIANGVSLRPKGEWILDESFMPFLTTCSKCGALYAVDGAFEWNFCPNCGADMRGDGT